MLTIVKKYRMKKTLQRERMKKEEKARKERKRKTKEMQREKNEINIHANLAAHLIKDLVILSIGSNSASTWSRQKKKINQEYI